MQPYESNKLWVGQTQKPGQTFVLGHKCLRVVPTFTSQYFYRFLHSNEKYNPFYDKHSTLKQNIYSYISQSVQQSV